MDLERSIDIFGHGYAATRSFTYPCEYVRIGPVGLVRDALARKKNRRSEEVLALGPPENGLAEAVRAAPTGRYAVCAFHEPEVDEKPFREAWKAEGYRVRCREAMMARRPAELDVPSPLPITAVETPEQMEALKQAAGSRQLLPEHLGGDEHRAWYAHDGGRPVAWCRASRVGDCTWLSNVYTVDDYRRRGLARAVLAAMLADDLRRGIEWSVLLASTAGGKLYPTIGYDLLGWLQLFSPQPATGRASTSMRNLSACR